MAKLMADLVEFKRLGGAFAADERVGNSVQLEDGNGTPYSDTNPLPMAIAEVEVVPRAVSGTVAVAGPTAIVAAPAAGYRLAILAFVIQNESATATTIQIHTGATATKGFRCWAQNQGDGLVMVFAADRAWCGDAGEAVNITLSGANQCGYSITTIPVLV